jgi:CDP-diacylglycerol--glycerol-3-phosphate 3-phosphatidyltransferase
MFYRSDAILIASMQLITTVRSAIRRIIRYAAVHLDRLTHRRLTPNRVTLIGVGMHVVIAALIGIGYFPIAALLLIIFGLFDTLDGELARLQGRSSSQGMLLDASTDRFKEVLLYTGIAYALAMAGKPWPLVWVVAACGASICVSYVKAKGEAALATSGVQLGHHELNRLFSDGLATFEIRIVLLIIGLLINQLPIVLFIIAILASYTAIQRLYRISHALKHA